MEEKTWNYIAGTVLITTGYSFTASVFFKQASNRKDGFEIRVELGF